MSCLPTPEETCNRKPFATDSSCDRGDVDLTPFADFPACSPISPTPPDRVEPPIYYPVVPPITPPPCACIDIDYKVKMAQGDKFDFKAVFGAIGDCCEGKYKTDFDFKFPCIPEITIQTRECNSNGSYESPQIVVPTTDSSESGSSGCNLTYTIDMPCPPCVPEITIQTRECNSDGTYKSPVPVSPKPTDPSGSGCDLTYTIDMPCIPCIPTNHIFIERGACSGGSSGGDIPPEPEEASGLDCNNPQAILDGIPGVTDSYKDLASIPGTPEYEEFMHWYDCFSEWHNAGGSASADYEHFPNPHKAGIGEHYHYDGKTIEYEEGNTPVASKYIKKFWQIANRLKICDDTSGCDTNTFIKMPSIPRMHVLVKYCSSGSGSGSGSGSPQELSPEPYCSFEDLDFLDVIPGAMFNKEDIDPIQKANLDRWYKDFRGWLDSGGGSDYLEGFPNPATYNISNYHGSYDPDKGGKYREQIKRFWELAHKEDLCSQEGVCDEKVIIDMPCPPCVPEVHFFVRECSDGLGSGMSSNIHELSPSPYGSGGCDVKYTLDMPCMPCVPEITIQTRECSSGGTYGSPVPVSPKPTDPSGSGCDLTYTIDMPCPPCVPEITIQTRECNSDGTYGSPVPVSPKPTDPSGSGCDLTYTIDMPCPPCVPAITIQTRECSSGGTYGSPVPVSPEPTDPSGSGCDLTYTIDMPCPPCVPKVTYKTKIVSPSGIEESGVIPHEDAPEGCDYTVTIPIPRIPCVPKITIQTRECSSGGTYGSPVPVSPEPTDPSGSGCDLTYTIDMPCPPCVPQVTYRTEIVSPSEIVDGGVIPHEDAPEGCDYTVTIPIPKVPCLPHITMKYVTVDSSGEPIGDETEIPQTSGTTDCSPEFVIPIPCTPKISISANVVNVGDDDDFGIEITPPGSSALCNQDFNIELRVPGYLNGGGGGGGDSSSPSPSDPCGEFWFGFAILGEDGESADSFCIGDTVTVIAKVFIDGEDGEDIEDRFKGKGYSIDYSWGLGPYLEGASGTNTIDFRIGENASFGTNFGVLNVTVRRMGQVICSQTSQPFNFEVIDCFSSSSSGGGGSSSDNGCWRIVTETTGSGSSAEVIHKFDNQFYLDGEQLIELNLGNTLEEFVDKPYICLKIPAIAADWISQPTVIGYESVSKIQEAQRDVSCVIKPLYKITRSCGIEIDFRNCPAFQLAEEL